MNFSVCNHGKAKDASGYIPYNDVEFSDIPDMVTSGFNYCACKLKNEYRLDDNFDGCVDVLVIDVDDSCTIEMAKIIFNKYQYYIITSKSHQKDKGGITCDRFRLFIPLTATVEIREQMEEIYSRFIQTYDFIDKSCRNVSRFFYSSPKDAIVLKNDGYKYSVTLSEIPEKTNDIELPTVTPLPLPNQEFDTKPWYGRNIRVLVDGGSEEYSGDGSFSREQSIDGVKTYLDNEFYQGNKGNAIYSASCMLCNNEEIGDDDVVDIIMKEWESRSCSTDRFAHALSAAKNGLKTR